MSGSARPSQLRLALRKPWYWAWSMLEKLMFSGRSYTLLAPWGHRVLTPWFDTREDPGFRYAYSLARHGGSMTVTPDRCYLLYRFSREALLREGEVAECGVFQGGTAHLLAQTIRDAGGHARRLHLFDTFQGMPDDTQPARDYHAPGDFADTSLRSVRRRLADYDFAAFHPGRVPETFEELDQGLRFVFVHLDMDIYQPTLEACRWFWPRMVAGGVMMFDDYGFYPYRDAARAAVEAWFAHEPETPIALPTGQGLAIKSSGGVSGY